MSRILSVLVLALVAGAACAADSATASATHGNGYVMSVVGSFGSLFIGVLQLVVGLAMIAFAIKAGFIVLSRLLGGIDIWGEIKKRNIAIALVTAGVVVSYTGVIGTGIESMTKPIVGLISVDARAWLGALTGIVASLAQLLIAVTVASLAITVTFKVLDRLTKDIDEKTELAAGNIAVGALYCGVLIGVSQVVQGAVGGVGIAVQGFLNTLLRPMVGDIFPV